MAATNTYLYIYNLPHIAYKCQVWYYVYKNVSHQAFFFSATKNRQVSDGYLPANSITYRVPILYHYKPRPRSLFN